MSAHAASAPGAGTLAHSELEALCEALRTSRGFAHKQDIARVMRMFAQELPGGTSDLAQSVPVGDDCAALPDGQGGYQLLAIEGLVDDFVAAQPWFAGYSAVMVNVSDIYAMGGRPTAVVNALWADAAGGTASQVIAGMAAAAQRYAVPIVGGHSNLRSSAPQLAVAITGRARALLTSVDACPGDRLVMAIDLRGHWQEPFPFWNASTEAPATRLRADLEVLPQLAETGLCRAAKDISMAGLAGTTLMLLESSGVGGYIDLERVPAPPGVPPLRWLTAFPSYGFVLSVAARDADAVLAAFAARGLASAVVGEVLPGSQLQLRQRGARAALWDWQATPFIRDPEASRPGLSCAH